MRLLRCIIGVFLLIPLGGSHAQSLWIRPEKYFYAPNETAQIELQSGEEFIGKPAMFSVKDLRSLTLLFRNSLLDISRNFREGEKARFTCNLFAEGIYQVRLETSASTQKYSRPDFAAYVKMFGLEELNADTTNVDTLAITLEKHFKCYLRVGREYDRHPEEGQSLGLEIVPDRNPLVLKRGDKITFTVLKDGKPAFGRRIRISNRWNNRTTIQNIYTQQDGTVSTTISSPGDWIVTVAEVKKNSGKEYSGQEFSLIFGYR
jgi:hypothetical protein